MILFMASPANWPILTSASADICQAGKKLLPQVPYGILAFAKTEAAFTFTVPLPERCPQSFRIHHVNPVSFVRFRTFFSPQINQNRRRMQAFTKTFGRVCAVRRDDAKRSDRFRA
jgi:hypothetical protein